MLRNRFPAGGVVILAFLILTSSTRVGVSLELDARFEDCAASGTPLPCEELLALDIDLSFAEDGELVTFSLSSVGPRVLARPLTIELSQSQPRLVYSLRHVHEVWYDPHEEVIPVEPYAPCDDEEASAEPTCGWAHDSNGDRIPDSQGVCCENAAHCYRSGDLLFAGDEIDAPRTVFAIGVTVRIGQSTETFTLRHDARLYSSWLLPASSIALLGALVEEYGALAGAPVLDNYLLYTPIAPLEHPLVEDALRYLMLVPREHVTLTGDECDKVGTGYAAFRAHAAMCETHEPGDCLHNQLYHKHLSDEERLIADPDASTEYLVRAHPLFRDAEASISAEGLELVSPLLDRARIRLEIDADELFRSEPLFVRGDCNDDASVDISDPICILDWLYVGTEAPGCIAVTDTNGDGETDLSDPIWILSRLFLDGPAPVAPYPDCGPGDLPSDSESCQKPPESCQQ